MRPFPTTGSLKSAFIDFGTSVRDFCVSGTGLRICGIPIVCGGRRSFGEPRMRFCGSAGVGVACTGVFELTLPDGLSMAASSFRLNAEKLCCSDISLCCPYIFCCLQRCSASNFLRFFSWRRMYLRSLRCISASDASFSWRFLRSNIVSSPLSRFSLCCAFCLTSSSFCFLSCSCRFCAKSGGASRVRLEDSYEWEGPP